MAIKYLLLIDHKAASTREDAIISLEAATMLDAMSESADICRGDDEIYCARIFEKSGKDTYSQILRGHNGIYFRPETSCFDIARKTAGRGANKRTYYSIV